MKPKVIVLKADGTNRDEEMAFAFKIAGADSKIVNINELRKGLDKLSNYSVLVLPGGFAYGDDIVSGKILAIELTSFLASEMKKFIKRNNTVILGVCNGFQVLVRTGLLPFREIGNMRVSLINNDSGHFECRWINMKVEKSICKFTEGLQSRILSLPIAHGEGKFFTDDKILKEVEEKGLVVFRYLENPNGSLNSIGGICDPTGRILGLMPHPECFVRCEQHPNWRRGKLKIDGLPLFENIVNFVKGER